MVLENQQIDMAKSSLKSTEITVSKQSEQIVFKWGFQWPDLLRKVDHKDESMKSIFKV